MATTGNPLMPIYLPPRARRGSGTRVDPELDQVRKLAITLDRYLVDPILGLFLPGAGDIVSSVVGLYTVAIALRRKTSPVVIARMLLNLGLDALIGVVPLVGDLFDFGFKANQRNVELLASSAHRGGKASARDWAFVVAAALLFLGVFALSIFAVVWLVRALV